MKNSVIARRYAKALLLIGKEDGRAETYRQELNDIAELIAGEKALEQAINNHLYNVKERRKVLHIVLEKMDFSKVVESFVLLMFDKGRIGVLPEVNDIYQKLADELKGVVRAGLISAADIASDTVDKIKSALSTMTGKDIVLEVSQDSGLIGGVVTRIGDLMLDGSLKTQLLNMKESLKRGESV